MNWLQEVQKHKDFLLKDLNDLLKIKSIKDLNAHEAGKPMGEEIARALSLMLEKSTNEGFRVKNMEGYAGFAEYGPKDAEDYIGILCHLDVVPATGEWTSPPFEPTIRDGKLFARGANDDKGPTMAAFYALKIIKDLGLPLKHRVRVIFGTDEESGMSCMKKYFQVEKMPIAGFAPDAEFPIIHAEKGQINAVLCLQKREHSDVSALKLHTFIAGEKGNMVPDLATAVISGASPEMKESFIEYCKTNHLEKRLTTNESQTEFIVYGKSAHGMEPQKGVNAALMLAHFLCSYHFQKDANHYLSFCDALYKDFFGENLGIAFHDDITGPLTVNAGIFKYDEKEKSTIHLNIRCPVLTPYPQTVEKLTKKAHAFSFELDEIREKEPHHVDKNHPLIQILQKAYFEETQDEPILLTTGGATYARFMEYGVAFGALFPGTPMTAHQKDEFIDIQDLFKATAIYARAIYELANTEF